MRHLILDILNSVTINVVDTQYVTGVFLAMFKCVYERKKETNRARTQCRQFLMQLIVFARLQQLGCKYTSRLQLISCKVFNFDGFKVSLVLDGKSENSINVNGRNWV